MLPPWSWSQKAHANGRPRRDDHQILTLDDYHQLDSTRYIFSAKGPWTKLVAIEREVKREVATRTGGYLCIRYGE